MGIRTGIILRADFVFCLQAFGCSLVALQCSVASVLLCCCVSVNSHLIGALADRFCSEVKSGISRTKVLWSGGLSFIMATDNYTIPNVENTVKNIEGTIKNVTISRLTAPGENFLSLIFKIDFEVEDQNGQTKTISTVGKRFPLGERPGGMDSKSMTNEIRWYLEMVPLLVKSARQYEIPIEYYPKYMGSRFSLDPEVKKADAESVLLLENLIPQGFKNEDRHIGFDLQSTKALLRMMAQFHALPLVMKFKNPQAFSVLKDFLDETKMDFKKPPAEKPKDGKPRSPPDHSMVFDVMLKLPGCQKYKEKLEEIKNKTKAPPMSHKPGPEPWNTVVHCDFWVNNVMIKHVEGQEPLTKLVDFQFYRYSTFARDLVFFLLTSVKNQVQLEHFDDLLKYYYNQLTVILNKFNISELELPYDKYLDLVKEAALETETSHAIIFSTVVFGAKGLDNPDPLVGEVDMMEHMGNMIKNMNDIQKTKLELICELAGERGWL
ncbi:unnamed protein product [Ceutorhynchus assimilis]|uniref:CHK kinase-like domain-containing protein n=1 Tax=Ceutorhynchus assimilis TaxID=467358 RepID=A0A9N9QKZ8_9CUCU|nr:unnamed protein product [Ceutorhynchus assimilis]